MLISLFGFRNISTELWNTQKARTCAGLFEINKR